jgi:hypothetical protein
MPIDLGPNSILGQAVVPTLKKPPFLVTLEKISGKNITVERFISLDKPENMNGLVQVKGIFCDREEDEIIKGFSDILTGTPKDLILEMMFPLHRVVSIRSLVFNAVKTTNQPGPDTSSK